MAVRLFGPGQKSNVSAAKGPISHYGYGLLECQGYRMQPGSSDENSARPRRRSSSRGSARQGKRHWLDEMIAGARRGPLGEGEGEGADV